MSKHTVTDLYARLLAEEMTFHVAKREGMINRIAQGVETPLVWQELYAENYGVFQKLKEGGDLVFMDYKNLRGSVVPEGGMAVISSKFSSSMSKDDFLGEAKRVVEEWLASSGRERKR